MQHQTGQELQTDLLYEKITHMAHKLLTAFIILAATCSACTLPGSDPDTSSVAASTQHLEYPAYETCEDIIEYSGFTSSYNHSTLVPEWVAYELTAEELNWVYNSQSSNFSRDPNLKGKQASREDYSHSGWDKGHMAPKADMRWSEESYWESHYFTNVCPQNHELNAGDWNTLEKSVRRWAKQYGTVWVVCGPIFEEDAHGTIGEAHVHIPDAFFKALLTCDSHGLYHTIGFVMPNEGTHHAFKSYACTVNSLEERIGRDLFPALDDSVEESAEDEMNWTIWNR